MIFERTLLGCAELRFLPGGERPRLPEPFGGRGVRGWQRGQEREKAAAGL